MQPYGTIVWATDGSAAAAAALVEARRLAELTGARIVAVYCDQRFEGWSGRSGTDVRTEICELVEGLQEDGVPIDLVLKRTHQDAADTLALVAAEVGAGLVVCGTRGLSPIAGLLAGSFTQRLLQIAPCPVVAVPASSTRVARNGSRAASIPA